MPLVRAGGVPHRKHDRQPYEKGICDKPVDYQRRGHLHLGRGAIGQHCHAHEYVGRRPIDQPGHKDPGCATQERNLAGGQNEHRRDYKGYDEVNQHAQQSGGVSTGKRGQPNSPLAMY